MDPKDIPGQPLDNIKELLNNLKKSAKPQIEEPVLAMCYASMRPPEHIEYICPIDGEKTVYNINDSNNYNKAAAAAYYRIGIKKINKVVPDNISFGLDETLFCSRHHPEAADRYFLLIAIYKNGKIVKNRMDRDDIGILNAFFNKELSFFETRDKEVALKEVVPRIKKLIGY